MASATGGIGKDSGSAKAAAVVEEHIIQAVKSTSNLIHLMQDESPSQVQIEKLTKNLLQKTATVKNTGQILRQMPQIISSLDAYMEGGLQSGLRLDTTEQMLSNMESSRIRFAFKDQ
ncbi:tobamovirus multiplication 2B isoform X1 [Wolffia australiana]